MSPLRGFSALILVAVLAFAAPAFGQVTINALTDSTPGLSQDLVQAGRGQFVLTVRGSGFSASSVVRLGNSSLTTTFVSGSTLTATVTPSLIRSIGSQAVTVVDGSNTSNSVDMKVAARGDANAGGTVNIGDALVIARSVGGLVKPAVPADLADANLNDSLNIGDALVVALFAGGVNTNLATPIITATSITTSAAQGESITVTGTGFSSTAGNNAVIFSKGDGTYTSAEATAVSTNDSGDKTLTVAIPSGAASGPIFVKRKDVGIPGQPHVISITGSTVPLYISKVSPAVGLAPGTSTITITGSGFSATAASNTVTFFATSSGGTTVTATPSSASTTSLTVTVPSTAVSGAVSVTVGGSTSNNKSILVSGTTTPLRVNHVYYGDTPGEPVLIEGTGFNLSNPADNQVTFTDSSSNEVAAVVIAAGRTELIVLVPTGAANGTLKVKTGSGSSQVTSNNYSFAASNSTGGVQAAPTTDAVDVIVTSSANIGAYQAVVTFDPNVVYVDPLNVSGGAGAGFTGSPMSINVDNVGGTVTINHFQVGNSPTGTFTVARLGFSAVAAGTSALGIDRPSSVLTNTGGSDLSVVSGDMTLSKTSIAVASNQIATITSLSPANANKGVSGFTLTLTGQKFARGATVRAGSTDLTTTYSNGRTLKATIPSSLLATSGNVSITVVNPSPGGGTSSAATFAVNNPVPSVTSISPSESTSGTTSLTLTVKGKNFVNGSKVVVSGTEWTTTFVSETEVTAVLPSNTTLTGGVFPVKVRNESPGGGDSASKTLTVRGGSGLTADLLISSPSQPLGAYQVTIGFDPKIVNVSSGDVKGGTTSGFAGTAGSPVTVNIDNTAGTVIINDFQTSAAPAGSSLKLATITFTPVSRGTSALSLTTNSITNLSGDSISDSATASLSVTSVQVPGSAEPEIARLDPDTTPAGSSAEVQVTIEGTDLNKDLVATFDGNRIATNFNSDTRMTMTIPASQLKVPGTYKVVLTDGTTSTNDLPFVVNDPVEAPAITGITPSSGTQGTTVEAEIAGTNLTGASEITLSGTGATATIGAGGSSTKIPVSIKLNATANTGARTITIKASGGSAKSSTVTFKVNPSTDRPALTLDPDSLQLEAGSTSLAVTVSSGSAVPVDTAVSIESSNAQIAVAPAAVSIAAGQSSTTFQVRATGPGDATLTLAAGGFSSASLAVSVRARETTDPIVESIDPASRANTAGTFTITIKGTRLKRANNVEFFGAGADGLVKDTALTVSLSSITEFDEDNNGDVEKITAVVTLAPGASPGARVVVVSTADLTQTVGNKVLARGGTSTKKGSSANTLALTGTDARPAITAVRPNTVVPGQSVDITIAGTNLGGASPVVRAFVLDPATQEPVVDQGLPVTVTASSSTAIVGRLVVSPTADAGPRAIIVKTADGVSNFRLIAENRLEVTGSTERIPRVISVSPGSGNTNTTGTAMTIKGSNLSGATGIVFLEGTTADTKVTTGTLSVNPAGTVLTTTVDIANDANPGARTLVVNTPTGASSATPSSANTFAVSGAGNVPAINAVSPAEGGPGQTISSFVISGSNLGGSSPSVQFLRPTLGGPVVDTGIQVTGSIVLTGTTTATMSVAINAAARPGPRLVRFTAGGLSSTALPRAENTFNVKLGGSGQPTITSLSTKEISLGTTATNFTISGTNLSGGTVSFLKMQPGGPVTDSTITVTPVSTAPGQIVINAAVASDADFGPRIVLVTTSNGTTGGQPNPNNVVQIIRGATGTRPHVSDVSPGVAFPGQAAFTLTVNGTGFTGATALRFLVPAPGGPVVDRAISVANLTVVNDTQLTAQMTIGEKALGGPHIVQVFVGTLGSDDFPGPNMLFIDNNSSASEPRIDRSEPGDAAPGQKFQLKLFGANFTGATAVRFLNLTPSGPAPDTMFTVGTPTVTDAGAGITVNVQIGTSATVGPRVVQVVTGSANSVDFPNPGNHFFVRPGAITGPVINFVQPPFVDAGATNVPFVINGTNLTGALASGIVFKTISSSGSVGSAVSTISVSGITVDPIGSRIAGQFTVTSATTAGSYLVQVTINGDSSSATPAGGNILNVGKAGGQLFPTITDIQPRSFAPGASRTVTLTGTNFTGASGLRLLQLTPFGPAEDFDVDISGFSVASATSASVTLTIGPDAGPGPRVIQILGADANSPDAPSGGNVIDVMAVFAGFGGGIQNLPNVTAISPTSGNIGQTITTFTMTGTNLTGTNAILFFAPGPFGGPPVPDANIAVSNITVVNPGSVTATVTINPGAFDGQHLVVAQTSSGPSPIFPDPARTFTVSRAASSGSLPVISSVNPSGGRLNATVSLTINGSNFVSGATKVSVLYPAPNGPQVDRAITVGAVTVNADGTQATTTLTIGGAAIPGPHLIVVSTNVGPSSDHPNPANLFAVESFTFGGGGAVFNPPDITSVTPGTLNAGQTGTVITVKGTNLPSQGGVAFLTLGAAGPIPDPNISFTSISFVSGTEIRITVNVAIGAASGPRAVVIHGPTGGSVNVPTPFNTILVSGGSSSGGSLPEIRNINPNSDSSISGALPQTLSVTVNGANLGSVTGAVFLIPTPAGPQADGALAISALTTSSTSVTFTLTIGSGVGNGPRYLVLKTSSGRTMDVPTPDNTFFVTKGSGAGTGGFGLASPPHVSAVSSPASPINPGDENITVNVAGENIQNATDVIFFSPGPGGPVPDFNVDVRGFTVTGNATSATVTATIKVSSFAPSGDRIVVVITPFGPSQNGFETANTLRIGSGATGGTVDFNLLPAIDGLSVRNAIQGQTITEFKVHGRNLTGATGMAFIMPTPEGPVEDTSIAASSLSLDSTGTEVTATLTIGSGAVSGPRFVIVRTANGDAGNPPTPASTLNVGFQNTFGGPGPVIGGPAITSISPISANAGSSAFTMTVTGTGLTGAGGLQFFQPTPNGPVPDPTIAVTSFNPVSTTSVTASVTIPAASASGPRFVVVPTPSGPGGLPPGKNNTFEVRGGVTIVEGGTGALIFSLAPQTVPAGSIVNQLMLNGQNLAGTHTIQFFEFGATSADTSITIQSGSIQVGADGKSVRAIVNIAGTAKAGPRLVVVSGTAGQSPRVPSGNVLNIVANSDGPVVEALNPTSGTPGQPLTLTIRGRFLCTDSTCTTSPEILLLAPAGGGPVIDTAFDGKITITSKTPTSLTAIINVPATLTDPQFRIVAVRTAAGRSSDAPSPGNSLSFGQRTNGPVIGSITTNPDPLTPGSNRTINLSGTNLQGVSVNFFIPNNGGPPQKDETLVAKVTSSSSTAVTTTVSIPSSAGGVRLVIVNGPNGDNFGQDTPKFITITNASAPTLTSVAPGAKPAGSTFSFSATGTNLGAVTSVTFLIPGPTPVMDPSITLGAVTVNSAGTGATGTMTIAATAPPGPRNVLLFVGNIPVLTEPTAANTFFVLGASNDQTAPFLFSASPTFLIAGLSSQDLTLQGDNLAGASVKFYNLDRTQDTSIVASVDVDSSSNEVISADIQIPAGASGPRLIVVERLTDSGVQNNLNQQPPIVVNIGSLATGGTNPAIEGVSPGFIEPGQQKSFTITGRNFTGVDKIGIFAPTPAGPQFDPNFTIVSSPTVTTTSITVTVQAATVAVSGFPRFFVVASGSAKSEFFPNPNNQFFVGGAGAPTGGNLPAINSIGPMSHPADNGLFPFAITGSNLSSAFDQIRFLTIRAEVTDEDTAFTVSGISYDSVTNQLKANVQIATSAASGPRVVIARRSSDGVGTPAAPNPNFSNVFTVGDEAGGGANAPNISSITPSLHAPDGQSFTFTVNGTNLAGLKFQLVKMMDNPQPNFSVNIANVSINSTGTVLTATLTIPSTSPTGLHQVNLLNAQNQPVGFQPPQDGINVFSIGSGAVPGGGSVQVIKTNGDNQTGLAGTQLAVPIEIRVLSGDGVTPISGVPVSFAVGTGGGFITPSFGQTDNDGRARAFAALGQSGAQKFTANASGITLEFTASIGQAFTGPIPTEYSPNDALVGSAPFTMTIRGQNFGGSKPVTGVKMFFGENEDTSIQISGFNLNTSTSTVTVSVTVGSGVTPGDRALALVNADGVFRSGAIFKVNANISSSGPTVSGIQPISGNAGQQSIPLSLSGSNLGTIDGLKMKAAGVDDSAITFPSVTATSTGITATMNIGSGAAAGLRNLVLLQGSTEFFTNATFQVNTAQVSGSGIPFAPPIALTAGTGPISVAAGDVNGDGRQDLVVANEGSNNFSVLPGNGNGSFQVPVHFDTEGGPLNVVLANLNAPSGDTRLDVIVGTGAPVATAAGTGSRITIWMGDATSGFASRGNYEMGARSRVAVGHFNGGTVPDVVSANRGSNTVSLRMGAGPGTLEARNDFATGPGPHDIAVADFNGDTLDDVAVVNIDGASVSVLLRQAGSANLLPKQDFTVGSGPSSIAVADLNGDNKPDIVTANFDSDTISVLINTTASGNTLTFTKTDVPVNNGPFTVAIGEISGDTKPDILVGHTLIASIVGLVQNNSGVFENKGEVQASARDLAIVDLNGDSKNDIVGVSVQGSVLVFMNTSGQTGSQNVPAINSIVPGNGNAGSAVNVTINGSNFAAGATVMAGSGTAIMVSGVNVVNDTSITATFTIHPNAQFGNRGITVATSSGTSAPFNFVINASGTVNLPILNNIAPNNGNRATSVPVTLVGDNFVPGATAVTLAGTGVTLGSAVTVQSSTSLTVTFNIANDAALGGRGVTVANAAGTSAPVTFTVNAAPSAPALSFQRADYAAGISPLSFDGADLNGDGRIDIVVVNDPPSADDVLLFAGQPNGTFAGSTNVPLGITGADEALIRADDLNMDGRPDLAVLRTGPGGLTTLLNQGGGNFSIGSHTNLVGFTSVGALDVGDLNGDNVHDVVAGNEVLIGKGDGTFQPNVVLSTGFSPGFVLVEDINEDGKNDVLFTNPASSAQVTIFIGNGNGTFQTPATLIASPPLDNSFGPLWIEAEDLNGDGSVDLAVASSKTVSVLLGNGNGTFGAKTDFGTFVAGNSVAVHDFNADGKPDLAVVDGAGFGQSINKVYVLLGQGNGTFGTPFEFPALAEPAGIRSADVNRDGRPDFGVVNKGFGANSISVFLNTTPLQVPTPTVTGITPNSMPAGSMFTAQITGTNFVPDLTYFEITGGAVSTSYVEILSPTQAFVGLGIAPNASTGARGITVMTAGGSSTLANVFTINIGPPPPTVTSVTPNSGNRGATVSNVNVIGTNFVAGATTLVFSGTGVSGVVTSVSSTTSLTAMVPIQADAAATVRGMYVVTGSGSSGTVNFTVNSASTPPPGPANLSTSPISPNSSTTPNVTGIAPPNSTVKLYPDPTCSSPTPLATGTATSGGTFSIPITVNSGGSVTIHATAETSPDNVSACSTAGNSTTYTHQVSGPTVSSISPGQGTAGQAPFTITIQGTGLTGFTGLEFRVPGGSNDTNLSATVTSASENQITATLNVSSQAVAGRRVISLLGAGFVMTNLPFMVNP